MAEIKSGDALKPAYAGASGNASIWGGKHEYKAAGAVGDVIELAEIPAGARVTGIKAAWSGLSATSTVSVGYRKKGTTDAVTVIKTSSAGAAGTLVDATYPIGPSNDDRMLCAVINVAAATVNGKVYAEANGEFVG